MTLAGEQRDRLVHAAGGRARDLALGTDAVLDELGVVSSSVSGCPRAAPTARATEHSRAAELDRPGAQRDVAVHQDVDARARRPRARASPRARRRRRPATRRPVAGPEPAHVAGPRLRLLAAADGHDVVGAQPDCGVRRERERHRQGPPAVVVEVLTDEVDPTGRHGHGVRLDRRGVTRSRRGAVARRPAESRGRVPAWRCLSCSWTANSRSRRVRGRGHDSASSACTLRTTAVSGASTGSRIPRLVSAAPVTSTGPPSSQVVPRSDLCRSPAGVSTDRR